MELELGVDNLISETDAVIEAKKERRNDWQNWIKTYKKQTEEMIKKCKKKKSNVPNVKKLY